MMIQQNIMQMHIILTFFFCFLCVFFMLQHSTQTVLYFKFYNEYFQNNKILMTRSLFRNKSQMIKPVTSHYLSSRNNKIQSDINNYNSRSNNNDQESQKTSSSSNNNFSLQSHPAVLNPTQNRSLSETNEIDSVKFVSLNKILETKIQPASKPLESFQTSITMNPKVLISKVNGKQSNLIIQGLKELYELLELYDGFQMEPNWDLKSLIQFQEQRIVNNVQDNKATACKQNQ